MNTVVSFSSLEHNDTIEEFLMLPGEHQIPPHFLSF